MGNEDRNAMYGVEQAVSAHSVLRQAAEWTRNSSP